MKKIYLAPSIEIESMEVAAELLDASTVTVNIDLDGDVDAGDIDSRKNHSIWDDED